MPELVFQSVFSLNLKFLMAMSCYRPLYGINCIKSCSPCEFNKQIICKLGLFRLIFHIYKSEKSGGWVGMVGGGGNIARGQ